VAGVVGLQAPSTMDSTIREPSTSIKCFLNMVFSSYREIGFFVGIVGQVQIR
jgi:hypothetical protein